MFPHFYWHLTLRDTYRNNGPGELYNLYCYSYTNTILSADCAVERVRVLNSSFEAYRVRGLGLGVFPLSKLPNKFYKYKFHSV